MSAETTMEPGGSVIKQGVPKKSVPPLYKGLKQPQIKKFKFYGPYYAGLKLKKKILLFYLSSNSTTLYLHCSSSTHNRCTW